MISLLIDGVETNALPFEVKPDILRRQHVFAHINALVPGSALPGTEIKAKGEFLPENEQKQDPKGRVFVAINHRCTDVEVASWERDQVTFKLDEKYLLPSDKLQGPIWISLFVDEVETNAWPFEMAPKKVNGASIETYSGVEMTSTPVPGTAGLSSGPE